MLTKVLEQVSEVIPGYAFRGAIKDSSNGTLCLAQASSIQIDELYVNASTFRKIDQVTARTQSYLEKGDVIIASRTSMAGGFKSCVFMGHTLPVLASSSILIIRPAVELLSEYLAIYLNSALGQAELNRDTSGSYIKALLRKQLLAIPIPIPDQTQQETLIKLHKNTTDQNKLLEEKIHIHKNIVQAALINTLNK